MEGEGKGGEVSVDTYGDGLVVVGVMGKMWEAVGRGEGVNGEKVGGGEERVSSDKYSVSYNRCILTTMGGCVEGVEVR